MSIGTGIVSVYLITNFFFEANEILTIYYENTAVYTLFPRYFLSTGFPLSHFPPIRCCSLELLNNFLHISLYKIEKKYVSEDSKKITF